ncbi:hypothetical protein BBK82_03215 [Lentzea guizhouensis]|uniref:Uncharacterized protein n=1 Tax=Lentzea guizhouensis TaxID=1586287 RepID=A0A1B2HBX6_9PSEU|nr:hypothetical protein [Lentzea guizhouensis]ANZ35227.1 hypothetical protein BBK82_03215 [Lentzea guizhouensis]
MLTNAAIELAFQQPPSTVDFLWWSWPTDEFAAWGQWAGGVGSIAAVIVALAVLVRDRRRAETERIERERETARAELEHRFDQARTVVGGLAMLLGDIPGSTTRFPGIKIVNHGARPILEVDLEAVTFTHRDGTVFDDFAVGTPEYFRQRQVRGARRFADVLGPQGEAVQHHLNFAGTPERMRLEEGVVEVTFTFLDIDGYRWRRVGGRAPALVEGAGPAA